MAVLSLGRFLSAPSAWNGAREDGSAKLTGAFQRAEPHLVNASYRAAIVSYLYQSDDPEIQGMRGSNTGKAMHSFLGLARRIPRWEFPMSRFCILCMVGSRSTFVVLVSHLLFLFLRRTSKLGTLLARVPETEAELP